MDVRRLQLEPLERRELFSADAAYLDYLNHAPRAVDDTATLVAPALVAPAAALEAAATRDPAYWPFAASDPFNTPLGSGAQYVAETSPVFTQSGASLNVTNWSLPVYIAKDTDPIVNVYAANRDILKPAVNVNVRVPADARPDAQGDHHLLIIDPTHSTVVELWRATRLANGNITATSGYVNDLEGAATFYAGTQLNWHGIRASGISGLAGLIRRDELVAGYIPHALAIAVQPTALNYNAPGGAHWVFPASWSDNPGPQNRSYGTSGNLYMGSLLAIPPDVNVDALGLSAQGRAIAHALQDYGAYIVESGGGNVIYYAEPASSSILGTSGGELGRLTPYLRVVANNGPNAIGGGGTPRAPLAPPFGDEGPTDPPDDPPPPTNAAPIVNAGPDRSLTLPAGGGSGSVLLAGTATDDGLPAGSALAVAWSTVSGPAAVTFVSANTAATSATFTAPGTYVLRLTATDGAQSTSDDVTVQVTGPVTPPPPVQMWSVSGTVTRQDNGQPLGNVKVHLFVRPAGGGEQYLRTVWTDAQGRFSFGNLAAGTYRVGTGEGSWRWVDSIVTLSASNPTATLSFRLRRR